MFGWLMETLLLTLTEGWVAPWAKLKISKPLSIIAKIVVMPLIFLDPS